MGRSKFPGKPSKHVNRKRINVLPPASETITECSSSMTVETVAENKQIQEETENSNENVNLNSSVNTKVSLRRRLSRKMQGTKALISNNTSKMGLMSKICNKSGVKTVSNKITVKNKMNCKGTRKSNINRKSVHGYSSIKNYKQCRNVIPKESNNLVGKFVLPTRSVHSSRVIKPNKRFINVDLNETLTLKKKVINKRPCIKPDEAEEASKSSSENDKSAVLSESPTKTLSNGRVVLRQARLKLHNQTPKGSEGPFSSSSTSGSPPGTVTCGVCGAVRFYRFVKQARKFNIYSCESCRKFISKLIKRQTCGKSIVSSTLVCHKGQGMCHVPPIVRSQQMKLIRCAYRSRCPACWLKMCLRSFQMPMSLKNSLVQLLPENMQGSDVIFSNSLPLLWQANVQTIDNRISNKIPDCSHSHSQQIKPVAVKQRPVRFKNTKPVTNTPTAVTSDVKRQKIDLKGPRVKHVCRSASIVLGQPLATFSPPPETDNNKKKPELKENDQKKVNDNNATKSLPLLLTNNDNSEHKEAHHAKTTKTDLLNFSESESSDSDKLPRLPLILNDNLVSTIKRDKNHKVPFSSSSCSSTSSLYDKFNEKKNSIQDMQNIIAIDYWENYDIDDISQNGFCLIASQQFPMPAICFLCGSAGREALLHCSLCCEPYHPFCLEQNPPISNNNNRQFMWLCPRCTTCNACNQTGRQKLNCQKCSKAYHSECLNTKSTDEHGPTICSKCLTCKGCGQENTTKFVGNLPLCIMCFKQRKKGNFCPICQGLYDDMDVKEMMMECTKCNKLIHSKCEGLSDEFFHILSILPESVKYLCNACSKNTTPYWRKAVDSELRFDFNQILRLLSKNKTARNILKLSPLNNHKSFTKTATTVKKIQFAGSEVNESDDINQNQVTDIFDNIDNNNKIFNEIDNETLNTVKVLSMLDIKNKLNSNEYNSVREFNREMEEALKNTQCEELLNIYRVIFQSVFPWFKPNQNEDDLRLNNSNESEFFLNTNAEEDICDQIECVGIDSRYCSFCKNIGDGLSHLESRLLYCGQNEWVHINCALWSSEVYEEIDGSLQNVPNALYRGRLIRCSYCKQKGATVGCCFKGCFETYHFICARTAKCHFMHNKTIYCGIHELPKDTHVISTPTEFNIRRSVFVELSNNKKGKYSQIDKVNVMVGSLCVTNLGKINPALSDSAETIIPNGYVCSRLYWSTIEPWKLVSYKISTSISNTNVSNFFVDKNFTVDHTLPKSVVERKLKEIIVWHKDIDKKKSDIIEFEDEEEPQNGADLLSPEITDAIFEDLPHELLDGISVQDIFPKLSYEDFINIDCKSETNNSDSGDVKKADEVDPLEFDEKSHQNKNQRSCSLTLSCKLDNSFSPVMKKRKIATSRDFFQLLQVDGNFDDSSSSECGSPTGMNEQNIWDSNSNEEPVTCERCQCTYRTQASYKRHLDSCDVMTSESDSELNQDHDGNNLETIDMNIMESTLVMNMKEPPQPVVLASYESYQNEIHTSVLNTQTFVTSKSTTSELISVPQNEILIPAGIHQIEQKTIPNMTNLPISDAVSNEAYAAVSHHRSTLSINEQTNQSAQFCLNQNIPLCVNSPLTLQAVNSTTASILNNNSLLNQAIAINQPSIDFQQPSVTIQSLPYSNNVTPIINVAPQNLLSSNQIISQEINVPTNRWGVKPVPVPVSKPTATAFSTARSPKSKARRNIAAKRTHLEDDAIIIPQTATATSSAPSVIVQHLPSTNFIPTFVDAAFQQQSGQNVQYVATLAPQINSTIHSQPLVQLQSDNNLISLMPGMQPTMIIQQPRVLENQLVLDSNGSLSWAPQPVQPVYYGFETIVQNTVMQSQQFLPSTVPGVLTANSSYSTTTQVFQTSKLEPVLDVAANSFVLLNPSQLVSSQPIEVTQNTQPLTVNSLINSNSATNHNHNHNHNNSSNNNNNNVIQTPPANANTNGCKNKYSNNTFQKSNITATVNANSITLPTAPFVLEQGIPTNIVTPTPKPIPTTQARPMSRVLPMQTVKDPPKIKIQEKTEIRQDIEKPPLDATVFATFEKNINENIEKEQIQVQLREEECQATINRSDSLKLLFQKQSQDGTYKVCNNFIEKTLPPITSQNNNNNGIKHNSFKPNQENNYKVNNNNNNFNSNKSSAVQVAPLKPIKSNSTSQPFHVLSLTDNKENRQEKAIEKRSFIDALPTRPFLNDKKENENAPAILYTIETQDGFKYSSTSVVDLWTKVFETVQNARAAHNMPLLPPDSTNIMNSLQILGLKTSGLKYLIEQLPGAAKCTKYKPTYNFPSKLIEIEDEPIGHSSGCARSAPNIKRNDPYDMFGWLASRHRKPELLSDLFPRRGSANNLPMATRFRQLKLSSKLSVGVYRSKIHRRGLFCLRDFDAGEMVIEYSGEVIRSILTDKREKYYNSKGIGCYMFRIDDNLVVDATMTGNAARFINHSCDPNCYSKVVEILGHKHIIIFALRRIICGEELTYDYKFPIEEDKIPCTCGTRRCRKFLN